MNFQTMYAVFRRNFSSYFSTPTGYVFICGFVFASAVAAFFSQAFFANNLANLDQLNLWLPWIMLIFVPTITMSIWSEERRQGTDELLLTLPVGDLEVVLGKFLASVAIFTASVVFSMFSVLFVMYIWLGSPDLGLFMGNYFGYWVVGVAMLSVGMVASFLTPNMTVAFILGALFNLPLVAIGEVGALAGNNSFTQTLSQFSVASQFRDFGQGVISLTALTYFAMIVVVSLYLCMVLIGRRHWLGGRDGHSMLGHFVARAVALAICAIALNALLSHADKRIDVSKAQFSKLSKTSEELLAKLDPKKPVTIDAYVSPKVPEQLVQTRIAFLNMLREIQSAADKKVIVNLHEIEALDKEAELAEKNFGIKPQTVASRSTSSAETSDIFMSAAVTCGLEKSIIPFLNSNAPVEYELVQAISVASKQERKKIGVLATDVELYGGVDMQTFQQRPKSMFVTELEKQYTVEKVDPSKPITEHYDCLVAVQPSTLEQPKLDNFIAAVKAGQPTVIFEDPMPMFTPDISGTTQPKMPNRNMGMMGMQQPPGQKGDIAPLWNFLGVDWVLGTDRLGKKVKTEGMFGAEGQNDYAVIWQDFLPYKKLEGSKQVQKEWVFVNRKMPKVSPTEPSFNQDDPITSGLQEVLFFYPGGIEKQNSAEKGGVKIKFTPLVKTGPETGTVPSGEVVKARRQGGFLDLGAFLLPKEVISGKPYIMAARIKRPIVAKKESKDDDDKADKDADAKDSKDKDAKSKDKGKDADKKPAKPTEVDVVLVADIDMASDAFFSIRAQGDDEFHWNFDNVTFVLNAIDVLAGDDKFVEIRKRKPEHPRLDRIDERTDGARTLASEAQSEAKKKRDKAESDAKAEMERITEEFKDRLAKLQQAKGSVDFRALEKAMRDLQTKSEAEQKKYDQTMRDIEDDFKRTTLSAQRDEAEQVHSAQQASKLWAILLPPIPPLLVAFFVFFGRRSREQEGVSRARLR